MTSIAKYVNKWLSGLGVHVVSRGYHKIWTKLKFNQDKYITKPVNWVICLGHYNTIGINPGADYVT